MTKIILAIVITASFAVLFGTVDAYGQQSSASQKITLSVSYANGTAQHYTISLAPQEKYTLSQGYSWVRDQTSRYNLVSYSIDNNPYVDIARVGRGNFTLAIPTDSSHSIVFLAVPQYPIEINGTESFTFSPLSPTGDNWFDINSDTQISVPYVTNTDKGIRVQLKAWSLDATAMQSILGQESGDYTTPVIHMSSAHIINFEYVTQYYVSVVSQFGQSTGNGWYDAGSNITISANAPQDFPVGHVLSGWEGPILGPSGKNSAIVLVDSPKTLTAKWSTDYTAVTIVGAAAGVAVIASVVVYQKRKPHLTKIHQAGDQPKESQEDKLLVSQATQAAMIDETYFKEVTAHILQKSVEKLDWFQTSGVLAPERNTKIKEKLADDEAMD